MSTAEQLPAENNFAEEEVWAEALDTTRQGEEPAVAERDLWLIKGEGVYLDPGIGPDPELPQSEETTAEETPVSFLPGANAGEILEKLPPAEFQRIKATLLRHARYKIGRNSTTDPEDIVALTLVAFVERDEAKVVDSFKSADRLMGSLLFIQQRKVADHYRAYHRHPTVATPDTQLDTLAAGADKILPDSMVFDNLLATLGMLPNLSDHDKYILHNMAYPGKSTAEMAAELGITEGNFRIKTYRSRIKMQTLLPDLLFRATGHSVSDSKEDRQPAVRTHREGR
jgi:DNA-directed RNA polymerase specialized sigma24 family protein